MAKKKAGYKRPKSAAERAERIMARNVKKRPGSVKTSKGVPR